MLGTLSSAWTKPHQIAPVLLAPISFLLATPRQTEHRTVVLLDEQLPDMGGVSLLECVARDVELSFCHGYVLLSVYRGCPHERVRRVLAALEARVVYKPFDTDILLETVAQLAVRLRALDRQHSVS